MSKQKFTFSGLSGSLGSSVESPSAFSSISSYASPVSAPSAGEIGSNHFDESRDIPRVEDRGSERTGEESKEHSNFHSTFEAGQLDSAASASAYWSPNITYKQPIQPEEVEHGRVAAVGGFTVSA